MKGSILTVTGVGGGLVSFFLIWNGWLSTQVISDQTNLASTNAYLSDIKETVHDIAQHEGVITSSSSILSVATTTK